MSFNDIDFDEIGRRPTAVYLIVPDEKTGYHGLVSLFIKQSYEYMIFKAQTAVERDGFHVGSLENRVNYVLDEFSSLPAIRDFPAMITAARSRNIRFTLAIQSKHQLLQRYKEETETIQTNCNNWIFFTSRELQFLEEISSICGKTSSYHHQELLSVAALQRMDKDEGEALLLCGRSKPCITKLADIEKYELRECGRRAVQSRKTEELHWLDFKLPLSEEEAEAGGKEMQIMGQPISQFGMDGLINQINKRIEKLE